jgi:hypothetical protein
MPNWFVTHLCHHLLGRAYRDNPDTFAINTLWKWLRNSLDSGAFAPSQAQWDKITLPLLTAGNWSGMGLHLRGNTEAFMRAASPHKKLRIHSGTHVHPFYTNDGRRDQLRFFDCWLKGIDNGVMDEPPVKLAIRQGGGAVVWRHESEWPLARTRWSKLYLDLSGPAAGEAGNSGLLVERNPAQAGSRSYFASGLSKVGSASASSTQLAAGAMQAGIGISLLTPPLPQDTEVTGPLAAVLWVSSSSEDMDLFLTIRNIGPDGNDVWEVGQQGQQVPVAKGWLRVSHRELDPICRGPIAPITVTPAGFCWRPARSCGSRSRSGRPRWCSPKATASHSISSRATASAACTTRTIMPTTTPAPTRFMPAATRSRISCSRSFRRPDRRDPKRSCKGSRGRDRPRSNRAPKVAGIIGDKE